MAGTGPATRRARRSLVTKLVGYSDGELGQLVGELVRLGQPPGLEVVEQGLRYQGDSNDAVADVIHRLQTNGAMGRTVARGYGVEHKRLRAAWAPRVATGQVACARCGLPIPAGERWDLGHDDRDRRLPAAPEHAACNRRAAAIARNRGFRRLSAYEQALQRGREWSERYERDQARLAREREAQSPAPRPRVPRIY